MTSARDLDEGGARQGDPYRLALTAIDALVAKRCAGRALRRDSRAAVRACPVAIDEGRDDEVALRNASHFRTDLVHHADEFVADCAEIVGRLAAAVPEVRTAHA